MHSKCFWVLVVFYSLLKHIKYWQINPGQDNLDPSQSPLDPIDTIRGITSRSGNELAVAVGSDSMAGDTRPMSGGDEKYAPAGHATVNGPNAV